MDFKLFESYNEPMLLWEVLQRASSFLENKGKDPQTAEWLFQEQNGVTYTELIFKKQEQVSKNTLQNFEVALERVLNDEPPQYIIGHEWFFDRCFLVNPSVLIPRPETEELVDLFLKGVPDGKSGRLVDIGTGSGAIGITIALERSAIEVTATDISGDALTVASQNAKRLNAPIRFLEGDTLEPVKGESFDFIISNPPYISESEWEEMDRSVQMYEPDLALFAADEGLSWYRNFAEEAGSCLNDAGMIFLEIGYQQGAAVKLLLEQAFPERKVTIQQDLAGKDRFAIVEGKRGLS